LETYVLKAIHEAKLATSWINPNTRYDAAMVDFARALLDPDRSRDFLADFAPFQARVAHFGAFNALAQLVIKVAAPGVPDFYQGTEVWDGSLVDPDNRRPVDFEARREMLEELLRRIESGDQVGALAADLLKDKEDGRVKMYVTHQALALRRQYAALFAEGDYQPLAAEGVLADHVCAFARAGSEGAVVAVVPRLVARRGGTRAPVGPEYWLDSRLPLPAALGPRFRNVFTGDEVARAAEGSVAVADVLATFPVALLERRG
ncbi:MAG: malto-oligosyltrehalose synthase, partial [Candidatus Rokuibacteriota bacterium]